MGRARKQKTEEVEELGQKDFGEAVRIYREEIRPAQARVGEHAQEQSTAYKAIKAKCRIQPSAAKAAFKLAEMEESKRDDYLRCFNGLLERLGVTPRNDLVDAAEGKGEAGAPKSAPPLKLVTVPTGPEADDALLGAAEEVMGEQAAAATPIGTAIAKAKAHLGGAEAAE